MKVIKKWKLHAIHMTMIKYIIIVLMLLLLSCQYELMPLFYDHGCCTVDPNGEVVETKVGDWKDLGDGCRVWTWKKTGEKVYDDGCD